MQAWQRVGDNQHNRSDYATVGFSENVVGKETPLEIIQASSVGKTSKSLQKLEATPLGSDQIRMQWRRSLFHLESQLCASCTIDSFSEYKIWLRTYVRFLAEDASDEAISKLLELCEKLVGLPDKEGDIGGVLGHSGRALLREIVLPAMARNRSLQGIVGQFSEMLEFNNI